MKDYVNYLDLHPNLEGNEERLQLMKDVLDGGAFLPKTVTYKDIDQTFKEWVEQELSIQDENGKEFPTIVLFSNQRFSEYSQSWKHTDENGNLLLNFKTIKRENNPQIGSQQGNNYNIPYNEFTLAKRVKVLDDNGSESFLDLKIKQPLIVDFNFNITVFTTKFSSINTFNTLILSKFMSRQAYIKPNGYDMPMTLESVSDNSQYNITDRQYYSQTFTVKVMGYIFTEDFYRVEEIPLKRGVSIGNTFKPLVEISEDEDNNDNPYYYKQTVLTINFPKGIKNESRFTIDTDFVCDNISFKNILNNYKIWVNNELIDRENISFKENDNIKIKITRRYVNEEALITFNGYNPNIIFDESKDDTEFIEDDEQLSDYKVINA